MPKKSCGSGRPESLRWIPKGKGCRERLDKSKKIAMEELQIFRAELEKIVNELKEMEEKLRNPNLESPLESQVSGEGKGGQSKARRHGCL